MGVESSACAADYVTGAQLGDAVATLPGRNVVLIIIGIGANETTRALGICGSVGSRVHRYLDPGLAVKVAQIAGTLRQVGGYTGPIVGMNYYNTPQSAPGTSPTRAR